MEQIVSFVSTYMTLEAGDAIFTGTSGSTDPMQSGDVTEVELEGCGNPQQHRRQPRIRQIETPRIYSE